MNWFGLLNQDVSWMTKGGDILLIKDMDHNHRRNAAAMLMRNAERIELADALVQLSLMGNLSEDTQDDSISDGLAKRNPEQWLSNTPLYKALVDGLAEDERVGALLGVPAS